MHRPAILHPLKHGYPGAIGEPVNLLVDNVFRNNVGYFVAEAWNEDTRVYEPSPIGTIFFVEVALPPGSGRVCYAVTCRHVVEAARAGLCRDTFIRVNDRSGSSRDLPAPIGNWHYHDDGDVAAALAELPPEFNIVPTPLHSPWSLAPGRGIFFVGMFAPLPGTTSVDAIVRTGTIARALARVEIYVNEMEKRVVDAHLVESRSWGGESGSPVYVYDEHVKVPNPFNLYGAGSAHLYQTETIQRSVLTASDVHTTLLGVLHGHFEIDQKVKNRKKVEIGGVPVNTGIGIVLPTQSIADTLKLPVFEEHREHLMRRRQHQGSPKPD